MAAAADFEAGVRAYERGDYERAMQEWRPLAEAGHPGAQSNLAVLYVRGRGVDQDFERAFHWFRQAARQDNAMAQYSLGRMYYRGQGVERDEELAARWIRRAALQGDPGAQLHLGGLYGEGAGVSKDPAQAVLWWRKSADRGNSEAQLQLGSAYETGFGVDADREQALHWYRESASRGNEEAVASLARLERAKPTPAEPRSSPQPPEPVAEAPSPPQPPEPVAEAPSPPQPVAAAPAPAPSGFQVQLAAYRTAERAHSEWSRVQGAHPDLLGALEPHVVSVDLGTRGTFYRLLAGPLPDRNAANELCEQLEGRRQDCLVR